MAGYQHPCRHCNQFIPPDSTTCPACAKINPLRLQCPGCKSPLVRGWKACNRCGLKLETVCPECFKSTFFEDYCQHCSARLTVRCPNPRCRLEQPPIGDTCSQCKQPLASQSHS